MKTIRFVAISSLLPFVFGISLADNCIEKDLWDITTAKICANEKENGDNLYVKIEPTCEDVGCYAQHCLTRDGSLSRNCTIKNNKSPQEIFVVIKVGDTENSPYLFKGIYDFQNKTRLDDDDYNTTQNSSYIDISASKTALNVGESVDLIIRTNKDYTGDIIIHKQHYEIGVGWQDSGGRNSSWKYTMKSSDNGVKVLSNFIDSNMGSRSVGYFGISAQNGDRRSDRLTFTINEEYNVIDDEEDAIDDEEDVSEIDYDNNEKDDISGSENGEDNQYIYNEDDDNEEDEDAIKEKQEELTENFNDALSYGQEKNYDKAIEILKEIVSKEGIIKRDNYKIAKEALRIFEEAIKNNAKNNIPELNKAINRMYENGLTIFNDPESFMAYNGLRRDEAAKFFVKYAKEVMGMIPDYSKQGCTFKDLDQAWSDLKDVIVESCQLGLFQGSKGKFMPTQQLTNAQAITVFMRLREGYKDESGSHFANNYYESAHAQGLLSNTPLDYKVNFDSNTTRGDVAKMLFRGK